MTEYEPCFFELSAADRALLLAMVRKLGRDSGPEIRSSLRRLLACGETKGRGLKTTRRACQTGRGRLLLFPRCVAVSADITSDAENLPVEAGLPPAL